METAWPPNIHQILSSKKANSQLCLKIIQSYKKQMKQMKNLAESLMDQTQLMFSALNDQIQEQLNKKLLSKAKKNKNKTVDNQQSKNDTAVQQMKREDLMEICKEEDLIDPASDSIVPTKLKHQNNRKSLCLQNGMTLQYKTQQPDQLFTCFLCLKERNSSLSFIFDTKKKYLQHLNQQHSFSPQFQVIIRSFPKYIQCSHAFFHGAFTKITKDEEIDSMVQGIFNLKSMELQQFYVCRCFKLRGFDKGGSLPMFYKGSDYFTHVCNEHKGSIIKGSSHLMKKSKGEKINLVPNKLYKPSIFSQKCLAQYLNQLFNQLVERVQSKNNRYLLFSPINTLYFFSNHPQSLPQNLYLTHSSCFCKICKKIFKGLDQKCPQVEQHTRMHLQDNQFLQNEDIISSNLPQFLEQQQKRMDILSNESQLIKCQIQLLNLNLQLINPKIYICGLCETLFQKQQQYMTHIYCQHQHLHETNTHKFAFLHPNTTSDLPS